MNFELIFYQFITYIPFVLLIFLILLIKDKYFELKNEEFQLGIDRIVFEIKTPKEITKTPLAMELVLAALHTTTGETTWIDRTFLGKRRLHFSLEIVSDGGDVRFFIWFPKKFTKVVESAFYSQYPSVQLIEVMDYTKLHSFEPEIHDLFGVEYKLSKANHYPIKTYKDFGLDKAGLKPEETTDPISHILEVMGNIKKGENMWLQIVLRAQKKDSGTKMRGFFDMIKEKSISEGIDWRSDAMKEIEELRTVEQNVEAGLKRLDSDSEKSVIDAISENISKSSFWTGIRSMYFSDNNSFDPNHIAALTNIFNTVNSETLNSLNAGGFTTSFQYSWNDLKGKRMEEIKKDFFSDYKRRKYFRESKVIDPHYFIPSFINFFDKKQKYNDFILSTEELATIYHLPSTVVSAPTFQREDSKKGEAPANLPF